MAPKPRSRQLHVWVTEEEYLFLVQFAEARDEAVGQIVRRLVRRLREQVTAMSTKASASGTTPSRPFG
jgi:hypothetical protein